MILSAGCCRSSRPFLTFFDKPVVVVDLQAYLHLLSP